MTSTTPTMSDLEALAAEEPFVRALARSLVFDASAVDDVVQQTFVECLNRHVPDGDHRRPWLARVVRTRALNQRRSETRRRTHEAEAARADASQGPDELVERAEQRRAVVEAVLSLPPIYRQVILLRYFENLPPRKIAAQLGLPATTASTRLKRALDMLRERFDAEHGGDRTRWQLALVPLAVPTGRAAAMGAAMTGWSSLFSAVAVPWLVLVLGLGLATWWIATRGVSDVPAARPDAVAVEQPADTLGNESAAGAPAATGDAQGESRVLLGTGHGERRTDLGATALFGRIVRPDGSPIAEASCRLWTFDPFVGFGSVADPMGEPTRGGPRWFDTVTDDEGRFAFAGVPSGGVAGLWLDSDGECSRWHPLRTTPRPATRHDVGTITLAVRGKITGTVVGADGEPIAGAEVWTADVPGAVLRVAPVDRLEPAGALFIALPERASAADGAQAYHEALRRHLRAWVLEAPADAAFQVLVMPDWARRFLAELPLQRTRTDDEGRFELVGVAPGDNVVVAAAPGHANGGVPSVTVREGSIRDVGSVRLTPGETFSARVVDAHGEPVPGAEVRVAVRPRVGLTGILFGSRPYVTDASGAVRVGGLPRGDLVVAWRRGEGEPWTTDGPYLSDEEVDLPLPATAKLALTVRSNAELLASDVRLRVFQGPPFGEMTAIGAQPTVALDGRLHAVGSTDGAHSFVVERLAPGLYTLLAAAPGHAVQARLVELVAGENETAEIVLPAGGALSVRVHDPEGGAVPGAEVYVDADGERDTGLDGALFYAYGGVSGWDRIARRAGVTGDDGTLVVPNVPAGGGDVVVRHPLRGTAATRYESCEGGADVVLREAGTIRGRLTLRGAAPPPNTYSVLARPAGALSSTSAPELESRVLPAADGTFELASLAAGEWEVSIEPVHDLPEVRSFGELLQGMKPTGQWWFGDGRSERVDVPSGGIVELHLDVDPTAATPGGPVSSVTGVVTVDGVPAIGWELTTSSRTASYRTVETDFATVGAGGRFARHDVAQRPFELRLAPPGAGRRLAWSKEIDPSKGPIDLAIRLTTATLTARVLDPIGSPAVGHSVLVQGEHADGARWAETGETDVHGTCRLDAFEGEAHVWAVGELGSVERAGVPIAGDATCELRLGTAGMFTGRVMLPADVQVEMIALSQGSSWGYLHAVEEDGGFAFSGLDAGRYTITLYTSDGERAGVPSEVEVGADGRMGEVVRVGAPVSR